MQLTFKKRLWNPTCLKIATQCFLSRGTDVIHSASSCFPPWKSTPSLSRAEFATISIVSLMKCYSRSPVFMTTHEKSYANAADLFAVVGEYDEWRGFFLLRCSPKKKNGSTFIFCTRVYRLQPWCVDRRFLPEFSFPKNDSTFLKLF